MTDTADFEGRRILITGAGTGIGATTAQLLAGRGARVAILDRDTAAAEAAASRLGHGKGLGMAAMSLIRAPSTLCSRP